MCVCVCVLCVFEVVESEETETDNKIQAVTMATEIKTQKAQSIIIIITRTQKIQI